MRRWKCLRNSVERQWKLETSSQWLKLARLSALVLCLIDYQSSVYYGSNVRVKEAMFLKLWESGLKEDPKGWRGNAQVPYDDP
jgi:hypothetical protein